MLIKILYCKILEKKLNKYYLVTLIKIKKHFNKKKWLIKLLINYFKI
jgi:hypothetical protein